MTVGVRNQTDRIRLPAIVVSSPDMINITKLPTRSICTSTVFGDQSYGLIAYPCESQEVYETASGVNPQADNSRRPEEWASGIDMQFAQEVEQASQHLSLSAMDTSNCSEIVTLYNLPKRISKSPFGPPKFREGTRSLLTASPRSCHLE